MPTIIISQYSFNRIMIIYFVPCFSRRLQIVHDFFDSFLFQRLFALQRLWVHRVALEVMLPSLLVGSVTIGVFILIALMLIGLHRTMAKPTERMLTLSAYLQIEPNFIHIFRCNCPSRWTKLMVEHTIRLHPPFFSMTALHLGHSLVYLVKYLQEIDRNVWIFLKFLQFDAIIWLTQHSNHWSLLSNFPSENKGRIHGNCRHN